MLIISDFDTSPFVAETTLCSREALYSDGLKEKGSAFDISIVLVCYSGQFHCRNTAKHSPQIITATLKYMSASGMAQTPKPLTVNQQAQPKKNPARNSGKAANCWLLASFSQQAIKQHKKEPAKKMKVEKPIGHVSGIRRLRGGGGGELFFWGGVNERV